MMSYQGVPVEEIAGSAGHASSRTTEVIHQRELRPVITAGGRGHGPDLPTQATRGKHAGVALGLITLQGWRATKRAINIRNEAERFVRFS